jgi:sortase A
VTAPGGSAVRAGARVVGELLITCGLVLLLFAAYEVWGKAALVNAHQRDLERQLAQDWDTVGVPTPSPAGTVGAGPAPGTGAPIGRLYVPRLGLHWVIVQGVSPQEIRYVPGHYPTSAMPGAVGNFAVAGHRSLGLFWDLDRLTPGDAVVAETREQYFVYRVTEKLIVKPSAVEVIAPVPGHRGQAATAAVLTLTTCNPRWDNYQRLIIHGVLVRSQPRSAGLPVEALSG